MDANRVPTLDETIELDAERKTLREGFRIGSCSQIFHETADANKEVSSPLACNKIESNNMNLDHQESEDANSIRGVSSHSSSQSSVLSVRGVPSLDETTKPDAKRKMQIWGFPLSLRSQIRRETADANGEVSSPMVCNKIKSNNMNLRHEESADANSIRGVSSHNSSQSSVLSERGVPSLDETIVSSHNTSDLSVVSESVSTLSISTLSNSPLN